MTQIPNTSSQTEPPPSAWRMAMIVLGSAFGAAPGPARDGRSVGK